jgi:molybdopterin-guanine dinucleotide biosynthesis protein A
VSDEPPGVGPLGGLLGLLLHAQRRGAHSVLAVACDLPRLNAALLQRLAHESSEAGALVTTQAGVRNPLIARYAVAHALPAARAVLAEGTHSLQAVLDRLGQSVVTLALTSAEEVCLADWDTPEDVRLR